MLNDKERDVIQKIVDFGGYVTTLILGQYVKDTDRNLRYILSNLTQEGLIRRVDLSRNPNVHTVYQVTKKACIMCNRGDSHMRKKHTPPFAARALLKSHFLFKLAGEGFNQIFSSPAVRAEYLKSLGFDEKVLPHKYNKGTSLLQIEEYILSGEPYSSSGGICVVHPDKCDVCVLSSRSF